MSNGKTSTIFLRCCLVCEFLIPMHKVLYRLSLSGFLLPSFPLDKHSESRVIQFSSVSCLGPSPKVSDRIPRVDYGVLG